MLTALAPYSNAAIMPRKSLADRSAAFLTGYGASSRFGPGGRWRMRGSA